MFFFINLRAHALDIETVADVMSSPIIPVWEKAKPLVYEFRKRRARPSLYPNFEYLYNEKVKWKDANEPR
jgi:hypothetical protein